MSSFDTVVDRCRTFVVPVVVTLSAMGCIDPKMMNSTSKDTAADTNAVTKAAPAAGGGAGAAPDAPAAPAAPSFPADNTKLVNKKTMLAENPALVEVENKIDATDPLSASSQGYFSIASRATLLNMKHEIDLRKADNDNKPPKFDEFSNILRTNNVSLKGLLRWQVYAYDEDTGELCILEDKEYKKREYEKAGVKWEGS